MNFTELYPLPIVTDFKVQNVVDDSRVVAPGDVFIFDKKIAPNGERFVLQALEKGAAAVITNVEGFAENPKVYTMEEPGLALVNWAKHQHSNQPRNVVAVTGTNGKTSVAWFYNQICDFAHKGKAASLGTLGLFKGPQKALETGYTTPTAITLHKTLHSLAAEGTEYLCMEASSHALALHRMDGVQLKAAAFTNLTPDHRDFHGSMEAYFAAKARLFSEVLPEHAWAVLNIQKMESWPLANICKERGLDILTVGTANAELVVAPTAYHAEGMDVDIRYDTMSHSCTLPLLGAFQAENVAAAIGLALASGLSWEQITGAMAHLRSVPGRMEVLPKGQNMPTVVVDYAHTPDSLERALSALKPNVEGRLWVVFGCGGNRDTAKRPQMGAIAQKLADKVIVTDDNPRFEEAAPIRAQILEAAPDAIDIGDRKAAITYALEHADVSDVVLIAGKGHESGQIVQGQVFPFDDRVVAAEILQALKRSA